MTASIRLLDDMTINQIAAGEVVENSASVVKELVENALDAGALHITVEILAGGRQLIRVSDDGSGMSRDDARLSLLRHATSKILAAEDLASLVTMGFRGEALAAIGSISKLRLITNATGDERQGHMIVQEGGVVVEECSCLHKKGSTLEISALFYNTPARRKFQRSISHETASVTKVIEQIALAYPEVSFILQQGGERLIARGAESLENRMRALLGQQEWSAIKASEGPYSLSGFISPPEHSRPNRSGQYLFINNRVVTSPLVAAGVLAGYGTLLETKRFPLFVLHLNMAPHLVDVNVHPQKEEVRLKDESFLRQWIAEEVAKVFHQPLPARDHLPWERPSSSFTLPSCTRPKSFTSLVQPELSFDKKAFPLIGSWKKHLFIDPCHIPAHHGLAVPEETMMVLHRERARETLFAAQFTEDKAPAASYLTEPLTLELSPHEAHILQSHNLEKWGFIIRAFGPKTFLVEALPASLPPDSVKDALLEFIASKQKPAAALAKSLRGDEINPVLWLDAFFALEQIRWTPRGEPTYFLCALDNYKKN